MEWIDPNCHITKNTEKEKKPMLQSQILKGWNVLCIYFVKTYNDFFFCMKNFN